jgi:uncharacterized protein (DUF305 family)
MSKKFLMYSLVGLLSGGAAVGFILVDSKPGQSLPASEKPQQPRSVQVDQHFIEMMIPHHQDAIAMTDLALSRAQRPEIKEIAEVIGREQAREIQEMRTWYGQWYGREVPAHSMTDMGMMGNHHNQGQGSGSGMMSPGQGMMSPGQGMMSPGQGMMSMTTDLDALKEAPDFDKEFVRQMIPHHQMAVMMAQMVSERATHPEISTLAQSIITSQSAELAQMKEWQQDWNQ